MTLMATLRRWWIYQRERFPIVVNGALVAALSFSAVGYSARLHGRALPSSLAGAVVAFVSCFLFFLQLRVADEFKDRADDLAHRPYRPVPRGLVTLRELGVVGLVAAVVQLGLAALLDPRLLPLLVLVWLYMTLMTREFFVGTWLRTRPLLYLGSHMVILPLIVLYATACDWLLAGAAAPRGDLAWFLLFAFFTGVVVELGRKLRAPEDEEPGVETYSARYGPRRATALWLLALLLAAVPALVAATLVAALWPVALVLTGTLIAASVVAWRFIERLPVAGGERIERLSGVWTLAAYLALGIAPLLLRPGVPAAS